MARYTTEQRDEAREWLRKQCKPGREIYQVVTHVSRSGMYRTIRNFIVQRNPYTKQQQITCIDWHMARALDYKHTDRGLGVGGCGMDMGFHLVYSLGRCLYPNGDGKTVTKRNGDTKPETDGGYLLTQRWL